MSRRRYLSTDGGRDKGLLQAALTDPLAVSFYLLAIPAAGDDATLPASDPDELLWEVWPAQRTDTVRAVRWRERWAWVDGGERVAAASEVPA